MFNVPAGNPARAPSPGATFNSPPGTYTVAGVGGTNLDITAFIPAGSIVVGVSVNGGAHTITNHATPAYPLTVHTFAAAPGTVQVLIWTYKSGHRSPSYATYNWTINP